MLCVDSEPLKVAGKSGVHYYFKCDCGQRKLMRLSTAQSPTVKSCGHRQRETSGEIWVEKMKSRHCRVCKKPEGEVEFRTFKGAGRICVGCNRSQDRLRNKGRIQRYAQRTPQTFLAYLLKLIERRCPERGVVCTISLDNLMRIYETQAGCCALSDLPMTTVLQALDAISVDQIIPGAGYTSNNVQLVCRCLNLAKHDRPDAEFRAFLARLRRVQ